jgi:outer membrane protein assembly factor BamC
VREQPEIGIIETDWYEDRAKIPQDIIRRTVGKLIDGMYSTGMRDKYRTRLEKGAEPGTDRDLREPQGNGRGLDQPRAGHHQVAAAQARPRSRGGDADPHHDEARRPGSTRIATAPAGTPAAAAGSAAGLAPRNAVLENNSLVVNDSFDRAWRRIGLALDRVGFTVEDRDRSKGIFYVRYIDPEGDSGSDKKKDGFWRSLKFWKRLAQGAAAAIPHPRRATRAGASRRWRCRTPRARRKRAPRASGSSRSCTTS